MSIENEDLKVLIGKNIAEYRKLSNMSQLEFAEKLNYSDKAISKWERGESLPDIIVLKEISDMFGITVNDLINNKDIKKKKIDIKHLIQKKSFVLALSIGLVFLISTIVFSLLQMADLLPNHSWLAFIYALPASSILCIVFFTKSKSSIGLAVAQSLLVWTLSLAICLSIPYGRIWYILIIGIPLQILIVLWNIFRKKKKL